VTVKDENGTVLERGKASRAKRNWWEFATRMEGRTIMAEAYDLPRNRTSLAL
jgi:hypothetical protein